VHWIFFYGAIKVSNVSVTLACFSSGALFASLLEPIFYKRKIIWYELFFGMIVMAGVYLIFKVETKYTLGILYSLIAAFLSALFAVLNGPIVKKQSVKLISLYEMAGAVLTMIIFLLFTGKFHLGFITQNFSIPLSDWIYLLILGLVCTSFAYTAGLEVMKGVSPYTLILTINLEPVYGIILAFFIFGEEEKMSLEFYIGALVIFVTIFADAWLKNKK
jgi:drug/metabolite transporter (DMT)-like permease